jgi:hypothetical protein
LLFKTQKVSPSGPNAKRVDAKLDGRGKCKSVSRVVVIPTSTHNASACRELGLGFGGLGGFGVLGAVALSFKAINLWEGFFVMCSSQQYLLQGLLLHSCDITVC